MHKPYEKHRNGHPPKLAIDVLPLKKAALILRSVNHPLREHLLQVIHSSQSINVTELYRKLGLEQSVASQQLAILRRAGFVRTERKGKEIWYSVNYPRMQQLQEVVKALSGLD